MFFSKKPPHHTGCLICHIVAAVLLFLASVASLVGVIMAHYDATDGSLVFGTSPASLSLIAFAVSVSLLLKQCISCMSECEVCVLPPSKKK